MDAPLLFTRSTTIGRPPRVAADAAPFKRTGSCLAVVKEFHEKELLFPRRLRSGAHKGELVWAELLHCRARQIIHNPRYAGACSAKNARPEVSEVRRCT